MEKFLNHFWRLGEKISPFVFQQRGSELPNGGPQAGESHEQYLMRVEESGEINTAINAYQHSEREPTREDYRQVAERIRADASQMTEMIGQTAQQIFRRMTEPYRRAWAGAEEIFQRIEYRFAPMPELPTINRVFDAAIRQTGDIDTLLPPILPLPSLVIPLLESDPALRQNIIDWAGKLVDQLRTYVTNASARIDQECSNPVLATLHANEALAPAGPAAVLLPVSFSPSEKQKEKSK